MSENQARFVDSATGLSMATFTRQNMTASDLYVTVNVPMHYGWGAVGIGDQMAGARMFIVYPAADAKDVTLSIRTAPGQVMPTETDVPACEKRNAMVVNDAIEATAVCYGFGDYSGLTTDAAQANWIYAVGPGVTVDSNSQSAVIMKHSSHGTFTLDMAAAHNGAASAVSTSLPEATLGPSTAQAGPQPISDYNNLVEAHGAIMGGSFIVLFPLAVILLRLASTRYHYIMTIFTTVMVFIGFVIGLVMSIYGLQYDSFNTAHQIIGILVVALLFVAQLPGGTIGHLLFKKNGKQGIIGTMHKYSGRILMLLGSINGILGFLLSGSNDGAISYGIISLLFWLSLIVFSELWVRRQGRRRASNETSEQKMVETSEGAKA